jgi:hypothetical protein
MVLSKGREEISITLYDIGKYLKGEIQSLPDIETRTSQAFVKSLTIDGEIPNNIDFESIKKRPDVNQAINYLENRLENIDHDRFCREFSEMYVTVTRALGF